MVGVDEEGVGAVSAAPDRSQGFGGDTMVDEDW